MTQISKVVLAAALTAAFNHPALGQVVRGEYVVSSNSQVTDALRPEIRLPVEQPKTVEIEVPDENKKLTPWQHIRRYFHDTYRGGRWLVIKTKPFVEFGANAANIYRGIKGYN